MGQPIARPGIFIHNCPVRPASRRGRGCRMHRVLDTVLFPGLADVRADVEFLAVVGPAPAMPAKGRRVVLEIQDPGRCTRMTFVPILGLCSVAQRYRSTSNR